MKKLIGKYSFKEWLSIQRIKLLSFIKNHKYISTGIFVFLFIGLIGMIVYAANNDYNVITESQISSITNTTANESDNTKVDAKSYSKISFNIDYKTKIEDHDGDNISDNRDIIIEVSIPSSIDAEWIKEDIPDTSVEIFNNVENSGNNIIKLTIHDVEAKPTLSEKNSKSISLNLYNIVDELDITATFKVYDSNNSDTTKYNTLSKVIHVDSEEQELTPIVVAGKSFKLRENNPFDVTDYENKYASYNVLLGIEASELEESSGEKLNLEGINFNNNYELDLAATNAEISKVGTYNKDDMSQYFNDENIISNTYGSAVLDGSKLKASDIKLRDEIIKYESEEETYIIVGSYYVLAKSTLTETTGTVKLNNKEVEITANNPGTSKYEVSLYRTNGEKLNQADALSYGETVILKSEYSLSSDADVGKTISVKIPIDNSLDFQAFDENKLYNVESYSGDVDVYFSTNANFTDELELANKTVSEINAATAKYFRYKVTINPGDKISFQLKFKAKEVYKSLISNSSTVFKDGSTESECQSLYYFSIYPSNSTISILSESNEKSIIVNGANTNKSTIKLYPSITNDSISDTMAIPYMNIYVALPKGIKYISNENYKQPERVSINTIYNTSQIANISDYEEELLVFKFTGLDANSYIEPISMDIGYSTNLSNGVYNIKSSMMVEYGEGNLDVYAFNNLENFEINYYYDEDIRTSLSSDKSTVTKASEFNITFELYNSSDSALEGDNYGYIELPNINENEYSLQSIDTANISYLEDSGTSENWKTFTSTNISYEDLLDMQITKLRIKYGTIASNSSVTKTIKIKAISATENGYIFKAHYGTLPNRTLTVKIESISISGTVWEDFNEDGIMDQTENKIKGVSLTLFKEDGTEVATTTSNDEGKYKFDNLSECNYYVTASYNSSKYALTDRPATINRSINSSFKLEEDVIKTDIIQVSGDTKLITNYNLGLTLQKIFKIKVSKYLNKAIITNSSGGEQIIELNDEDYAAIDVRDTEGLSIKVIYTIELQNTGSYPGYVYNVRDLIPDGMEFNPDYEENANWTQLEDGILEYNDSTNELIYGGGKRRITLALDINYNNLKDKESTFVNTAYVNDEDIKVLTISDIDENDISNESDDNSGSSEEENPNDDEDLPPDTEGEVEESEGENTEEGEENE